MNKKRTKLFLALVLFLILIWIIFAYFKNDKPPAAMEDKINVAASFYPIYFLASEVGGDLVNINNLTPAGTEPHDYELTAQDIVQIKRSELLFLNGGGLEVWGDKTENIVKSNGPNVVVLGDGIMDRESLEVHGHGDEEHEEDEHGNEHEKESEENNQGKEGYGKDPHIWLNPVLAITMAEKISSELTRIDSENAGYYQANLDVLRAKLLDLDNAYQEGLKSCKTRNFITSHSAFGYLAERYELNQISIAGLSPEEEPSSRQLAKVAKFAKENQLKYIFFESLTNPKLSETIAKEVGAQTLVLNPIEGLSAEDASQGKNYFTEMEKNLENLKVALECN
jgi:zinc transport system substrate-binding protein